MNIRSDRAGARSMHAAPAPLRTALSHETAMSDPLAVLCTEHVNFVQLLDLLDVQLERLQANDSPDYVLMLDIMFYMTRYPDLLHHVVEDLAFEKIRERSDAARPLVDDLMKQHEILKESGEQLVAALDNVVNGSLVSRDRVEEPGRTYVATFRSHMKKEEIELFPVAATVLNADDWRAITSQIRFLEDPIFGESAVKRFAGLRDEIAKESRLRRV